MQLQRKLLPLLLASLALPALAQTTLNGGVAGANSVAIAPSSTASGGAIAIGDGANGGTSSGVAVGINTVSGTQTVAIGAGASGAVASSVAVGTAAATVSHSSVAVGMNARGGGTYSTAIGFSSIANGSQSVSIGSSMFGQTVSGTGNVSVAGGDLNGSGLGFTNSVAIGSGAGSLVTGSNQFSIGNRVLKGVTAGVAGTDAVNMNQLGAVETIANTAATNAATAVTTANNAQTTATNAAADAAAASTAAATAQTTANNAATAASTAQTTANNAATAAAAASTAAATAQTTANNAATTAAGAVTTANSAVTTANNAATAAATAQTTANTAITNFNNFLAAPALTNLDVWSTSSTYRWTLDDTGINQSGPGGFSIQHAGFGQQTTLGAGQLWSVLNGAGAGLYVYDGGVAATAKIQALGGIDAAGTRIENVADPVAARDAVNLQTLNAALLAVPGGDPTIQPRVTALESRMSAAEAEIAAVKRLSAAGTAMAMASNISLPPLTRRNPTACGAGVGTFGGESATAISCAHRLSPGTVVGVGGGFSSAGSGFKVSFSKSW